MAKKSVRESLVLSGSKKSLRAEWRLDWDVSNGLAAHRSNGLGVPSRIYLDNRRRLRLRVFPRGPLMEGRVHPWWSLVVVGRGRGVRRLVGPNRKYHPSGRRKQNRNNSRFVELEEFPRLKLLPGLGAKVDDQERRLYKASIPYNPAFRAISKHQDRTFLEL